MIQTEYERIHNTHIRTPTCSQNNLESLLYSQWPDPAVLATRWYLGLVGVDVKEGRTAVLQRHDERICSR